MRSFATDETNDLFIQGRNLAIVTDLQAVLNVAKHAAQAILGEMVFAKTEGMPYFETIWSGNPTSAAFEAAFRVRVARIPGVETIASLEANQVGDAMQYRAEIVTIYGAGVVNG
jgi:hypothetical protein